MARFSASDEAVIGASMRRGGVVFLCGQRGIGLTHYAARLAERSLDSSTLLARIDLARLPSSDLVAGAIASQTPFSSLASDPNGLMVELAREFRERGRRCLFVCTNCHRGSSSGALDWILRAALGGYVGASEAGASFLFEGAVDANGVLRSLGLNGSSLQVAWADFGSPWRSILEMEELCRANQLPSYSPILPAWLADVAGSDIALAKELIAGIPTNMEAWSGEVLEERRVAMLADSAASFRIRDIIKKHSSQPDVAVLLKKLAAGSTEYGHPPQAQRTGWLQELFFDGLLGYDPLARAYRIRSGIVGQIVAQALAGASANGAGAGVRGVDSPIARAMTLLAPVATLELGLRADISASRLSSASSVTKTATGLRDAKRAVVAEVAKLELEDGEAKKVMDAIGRALPEQETIDKAIERRRGKDGKSDQNAADLLTLRELISVAQNLGIMIDKAVGPLTLIADRRNDIAHFRGVAYDDALSLLRSIELVFAQLKETQSGRTLPGEANV
ncbi:hypothetical protein [Vulgatibacter sp.]|uniref:hypothetical protein n=1 Tax=Vulgatibacter sp. TaxID=1971226 RepID=UPI003565199C